MSIAQLFWTELTEPTAEAAATLWTEVRKHTTATAWERIRENAQWQGLHKRTPRERQFVLLGCYFAISTLREAIHTTLHDDDKRMRLETLSVAWCSLYPIFMGGGTDGQDEYDKTSRKRHDEFGATRLYHGMQDFTADMLNILVMGISSRSLVRFHEASARDTARATHPLFDHVPQIGRAGSSHTQPPRAAMPPLSRRSDQTPG